MHYVSLPYDCLARPETETEDNILSPSPETFGNIEKSRKYYTNNGKILILEF